MTPVLKTGELADSAYVKNRGMIETVSERNYTATVFSEGRSFLQYDRLHEAIGESNELLIPNDEP